MIAIHLNRVIKSQSEFIADTKRQRESALKKLKKINKNLLHDPEKEYLRRVIELFENDVANENIVTIDVNVIQQKIFDVGPLPPISRFYKNGRPKKTLKSYILDALNYTYLRKSFYPKYFKSIGIKACVYCNSQLTLSVNKMSSNGYSAKFDVDHYHSKDEYPFLSISLFNLYPACASCNRLKGTKKIEFELYSDDLTKTKKSEYKFKLESNAKAKYLTTKDSKEIEFTFIEPSYSVGTNNFNEVFHIQGIYQSQVDLIEELIIKSQIYNDTYLKNLQDNFKKLNLHPELFKRMLVGNYTEDKDIHKRPMSKLVMDIAKELELIK